MVRGQGCWVLCKFRTVLYSGDLPYALPSHNDLHLGPDAVLQNDKVCSALKSVALGVVASKGVQQTLRARTSTDRA